MSINLPMNTEFQKLLVNNILQQILLSLLALIFNNAWIVSPQMTLYTMVLENVMQFQDRFINGLFLNMEPSMVLIEWNKKSILEDLYLVVSKPLNNLISIKVESIVNNYLLLLLLHMKLVLLDGELKVV